MGDSSGSSSPEVRNLRERVETLERRQERLLNALVEQYRRNERLRELLDAETERELNDSGEYPTLAAILEEATDGAAVGSSLGIGDTTSGQEMDESDSEEGPRRI